MLRAIGNCHIISGRARADEQSARPRLAPDLITRHDCGRVRSFPREGVGSGYVVCCLTEVSEESEEDDWSGLPVISCNSSLSSLPSVHTGRSRPGRRRRKRGVLHNPRERVSMNYRGMKNQSDTSCGPQCIACWDTNMIPWPQVGQGTRSSTFTRNASIQSGLSQHEPVARSSPASAGSG